MVIFGKRLYLRSRFAAAEAQIIGPEVEEWLNGEMKF
jgi:hypothetical protein